MTTYRYLGFSIPCWIAVRRWCRGPTRDGCTDYDSNVGLPRAPLKPSRLQKKRRKWHNMAPNPSDLVIAADVNSQTASDPLKGMSWSEWLARGRADEARGAERRLKVVKWASIALFAGVAVLWQMIGPNERVLMFIIALGAFALMLSSFRAHLYVLALLFGGAVLLYNPLFPMFSLSGGWQRLLVVVSIVPFLISLIWPEQAAFVPARVRTRSQEERS